MTTMTVQLRSIRDTQAVTGWADGHTVVVDRPDGKAGGMGLGFNGGQLLGLAIGGCFCNDLHYAAHELGGRLDSIEVTVDVTFEGQPQVATGATMQVSARPATSETDVDKVIRRAFELSAISNTLRKGLDVRLNR